MEPDQVITSTIDGKSYSYNAYGAITSQVVAQTAAVIDDKVKQEVLKQLSTRDLLNECYRRRAIEKFSLVYEADNYMLQDPAAMDRVKAFHMKEVAASLANHKYFTDRAVRVINSAPNMLQMTTSFVAEVYVCSHPSVVKAAKI